MTTVLALSALLFFTAPPAIGSFAQASPQSATPAADSVSSRITIKMPQEDATLIVDGQQDVAFGAVRTIDSQRLPRRAQATTTLTVQWKPNGYTEMTRTKQVRFAAGDPVTVDLSVDQ